MYFTCDYVVQIIINFGLKVITDTIDLKTKIFQPTLKCIDYLKSNYFKPVVNVERFVC